MDDRPILIVMRLADMHRVHPEQIAGKCERCGHDVAIYPSGQNVLRQRPDVEIVCEKCQQPGLGATLAPGAEREPFESRKAKGGRPTNDPDAAPDLGTCCHCGRTDDVRTILMLPRRGPTPGHGWGCVVCGLPCDGAIAVLCDACNEVTEPNFVCAGYPKSPGRVPFNTLSPDVFEHDPAKHPEGDYHDFAH